VLEIGYENHAAKNVGLRYLRRNPTEDDGGHPWACAWTVGRWTWTGVILLPQL